jgi:3-hydroxyacyl-CoA dehydrogenase
VEKALTWFDEALKQDITDGFNTSKEAEVKRSLVSVHHDLPDALAGAEYVQESGPEKIEIKKEIFSKIDLAAEPASIIASSTSALDINQIVDGLEGASRCITAHPFNPPFVTPAVEVLPAKMTDPEVTRRTIEFLKTIGMKPVLLNHYVMGFLGNRIQAAVVREAIHLVEKGVADVDAVDTVVREGLGLRWALLGNFGVNNTNADGGVRQYYDLFGSAYQALMNDLDPTPPSFDSEINEKIGRQVEAMEGNAPLSQICRWRDRLVRKIRALKEKDPHP